MSSEAILSQVHDFSDLELATLLCLIAKEHCLFETPSESLNDTAQELALISSEVFGLSNVVLDCSENTTIDEFGDAILSQESSSESDSPIDQGGEDVAHIAYEDQQKSSSRLDIGSFSVKLGSKVSSSHRLSSTDLDNRKIANVIIAKNFNLTSDVIQIQALELIRRGRILSRTTVHVTSEPFLFLPVVTSQRGQRRLNKHLLDHIFISHSHGSEDGFRNLEDTGDYLSTSPSQSSLASVVHKPSHSASQLDMSFARKISLDAIKNLQAQSTRVYTSPEIRRYIQNIIVFLRLERGVAGGVSPKATTHLQLLTKCLAPLHSLSFITPSLVQLAAPKIYRHRLHILSPEEASQERSMMYGSNVEAVRENLEDLADEGAGEEVVKRVLERVECPL